MAAKIGKNVTPAGVGEAFINAIEVSPHDPAKAYIAVTGHRSNDFTPHAYKTDNYGESWSEITEGLPEDTFVRVVREDPERPGLLYAGTETGMFVSFNDGAQWQSLRLNLPIVPVTDITARQGDLIVSTNGRGFWVLDKPAPLRQLNASLKDEALHLFDPADVYRIGGQRAAVYFYLKGEPADTTATFEVLDNAGEIIRTVKTDLARNECMEGNAPVRGPFEASDHELKQGLNRWTWDLRRDSFACIENLRMFAGTDGARVVPGEYQIRVSVGAHSQTKRFKVRADPRSAASKSHFAELDAHLEETASFLAGLIDRLDRLRTVRDQVVAQTMMAADHARFQAVKASSGGILARITGWEAAVSQPKHETVEDEINYPNMLDAQLMHLMQTSDRGDVPITNAAKLRLADLSAEWDTLLSEYNSIMTRDIAAFNALLQEAGVDPVASP